jgi:hypothetical protein
MWKARKSSVDPDRPRQDRPLAGMARSGAPRHGLEMNVAPDPPAGAKARRVGAPAPPPAVRRETAQTPPLRAQLIGSPPVVRVTPVQVMPWPPRDRQLPAVVAVGP